MQIPLSNSPEAMALHDALQHAVSEPLECALTAVESQLGALSDALRERELTRIDRHARELQLALAHALDVFSAAARRGGVPRELRQRLMKASAQVAALREALGRATAALDRALDALLPTEPSAIYAMPGNR